MAETKKKVVRISADERNGRDTARINRCLLDPNYTVLGVEASVSVEEVRALLALGSPFIREIFVSCDFVYRSYNNFPAVTEIHISCVRDDVRSHLIDLRGLPRTVKTLHIVQETDSDITLLVDDTYTGIETLHLYCTVDNVRVIKTLARHSPNVRELVFEVTGSMRFITSSTYLDLIAPLTKLKKLRLNNVPLWCTSEMKGSFLNLDELTFETHGGAETLLLEDIVFPLAKADNLKAFSIVCDWEQPSTRKAFIDWAKHSRSLESLRVGDKDTDEEIEKILRDKRVVRALLLPAHAPRVGSPSSGSGVARIDPDQAIGEVKRQLLGE